jgi:hypothetical protein
MLKFFAEYREVLAESIAIVVVLMVVLLTRRRPAAWMRTVEQGLGQISRRRGLSMLLVGFLALGSSATLSLFGHMPEPSVHDEFCDLLAADTFSRGRLSNPTHPLWVHFESFHILQQPIYASKYPPAQGLMLALGQLIGGHPIVGLWISTGLACAAVYWRLTGDALRMPYQVYEAAYAPAPLFLWQHPSPMPKYRHTVMRNFYVYNDYLFREQHTLQGLARMIWQKVKTLWRFYQGWRYLRLGLTIPLLMLPWLVRNHWTQFAILTCCVFAVGLLVEPWLQTHYAAPLTALVGMLVLQAARHMWLWHWRGRPVGKVLVWTLVAITVVSFAQAFAQRMQLKPIGWEYERARILRELKADGRQHLVIVRYGPKHQQNDEWVYNEADIDGARVVWAREMDLLQTSRLIEYFKDREVWLAEINDDDIRQKLVPYPIAVGR